MEEFTFPRLFPSYINQNLPHGELSPLSFHFVSSFLLVALQEAPKDLCPNQLVYMCTCLNVCIRMYLHAYMYAFEYMYVMYVFELM